ncbi:MAG TPA: lysophospholipid acyltransferase family protein [Gemmatimonadaceae bacterium]|nr:lysophospholipid acyltransferase family protein [Gemmatimonadaceae bacterium]
MAATIAHRLEYAALRGFTDALAPLGPRAAGRVAGAIARLAYSPLGIRRGVVRRQIAAAFPELGPEDIGRIARESYTNLGRVALEAILWSRGGPSAVLDAFGPSPGWDIVERAHARGRGLIIVSGHLGNWELSGAYIAARGVPLHAIARGMANPLSDAFFRRTREHLGMHIMHDQDAVRRVPRVLRDGHAVGILLDQATVGLASTFVPFFGRPAKTPRGAAVFALRFDAPIVYGQAVRLGDGRYEWVAEEIALSRSDDRERDTDAITARVSEALERMVRRYPGQYFWQHRRWKHQPAGTPAALMEP